MLYLARYKSVLGVLTLVCDEKNLVGLWIESQKYFMRKLTGKELIIEVNLEENLEKNLEEHAVLLSVKCWLDRYFAGQNPDIKELSLAPSGSEFQQLIWKNLCEIPYGQVTTYGELAKKAADQMGKSRMSAQAVGGAVGKNPISIIIPCHRVVGADGSLTGYAGGVEKKRMLLELEKMVLLEPEK